jgi:hypothetical protein
VIQTDSRPTSRGRRALVLAVTVATLGVVVACGSGDTTATDVSGSPTTAAAAPGGSVPGNDGQAPGTVATTTPPTTDPGALPQTDAKPSASGEQWDRDVAGLWDAIVTDDVQKARPFFFPLAAYKQVKQISDPAGDYDKRLITYYDQDIHALHKQLGANASKAKFVKLDVPSANAQWIKPGVEYNKGAYWRVFDSKLLYTVDGKQSSMLVKSMISWRGEWYVVHLSSIR